MKRNILGFGALAILGLAAGLHLTADTAPIGSATPTADTPAYPENITGKYVLYSIEQDANSTWTDTVPLKHTMRISYYTGSTEYLNLEDFAPRNVSKTWYRAGKYDKEKGELTISSIATLEESFYEAFIANTDSQTKDLDTWNASNNYTDNYKGQVDNAPDVVAKFSGDTLIIEDAAWAKVSNYYVGSQNGKPNTSDIVFKVKRMKYVMDRKPAAPQFQGAFNLETGKVDITVTVPSTYDWESANAPIPADKTFDSIIVRTQDEYMQYETIHTATNKKPGEEIKFEYEPKVFSSNWKSFEVIAQLGVSRVTGYGNCPTGEAAPGIEANGMGMGWGEEQEGGVKVTGKDGTTKEGPITLTFNIPDDERLDKIALDSLTVVRQADYENGMGGGYWEMEDPEEWVEPQPTTILVVKEADKLKRGVEITATDENPNMNKRNTYQITTYWKYGPSESWQGQVSVFVGEDTPGSINVANGYAKGNDIILTWEAPQGQNQGWVDPAKVEYMITRRLTDDRWDSNVPGYYASLDTIVTREKFPECQYIDTVDTDTIVRYTYEIRTGSTVDGEETMSSWGKSLDVMAGPAYDAKEFEEKFCSKRGYDYAPDNYWAYSGNDRNFYGDAWKPYGIIPGYLSPGDAEVRGRDAVVEKTTTIDDWGDEQTTTEIIVEDYFLGLQIYNKADEKRRDEINDNFTSWAIDMSAMENPVVTFYYAELPFKSDHTISVSAGTMDMALADYQNVTSVKQGNPDAELGEDMYRWAKVYAPISSVAGEEFARININFNSNGESLYPVDFAVDDIALSDWPGVKTLSIETTDTEDKKCYTLSWDDPVTPEPQIIVDTFDIYRSADGKEFTKIGSTSDIEYEDNMIGADGFTVDTTAYTYYVVGVYSSTFSMETPKSPEAKVAEVVTPKTNSIYELESGAADSRYYNVGGIEVKNPQAKEVLIKVNGKKAEKVVK